MGMKRLLWIKDLLWVDLASFGFAKYLKIGSAINKFKSVPTKTSMKTMRELTKSEKS